MNFASVLPRGEIQSIARALDVPASKPSAAILSAMRSKVNKEGEAKVERKMIHAAFDLMDNNGDGVISRIEVIKALREHQQVQALLKLPEKVRQEDGTRDSFEQVYQAIDKDDSKSITIEEFEAYFAAKSPAPAAATDAAGGRWLYRAMLVVCFLILMTTVYPDEFDAFLSYFIPLPDAKSAPAVELAPDVIDSMVAEMAEPSDP